MKTQTKIERLANCSSLPCCHTADVELSDGEAAAHPQVLGEFVVPPGQLRCDAIRPIRRDRMPPWTHIDG